MPPEEELQVQLVPAVEVLVLVGLVGLVVAVGWVGQDIVHPTHASFDQRRSDRDRVYSTRRNKKGHMKQGSWRGTN